MSVSPLRRAAAAWNDDAVAVGDADEHDASSGPRRGDRVVERLVVAGGLEGDVDPDSRPARNRARRARPRAAARCARGSVASSTARPRRAAPARSAVRAGRSRTRRPSCRARAAEVERVQRDPERLEQRRLRVGDSVGQRIDELLGPGDERPQRTVGRAVAGEAMSGQRWASPDEAQRATPARHGGIENDALACAGTGGDHSRELVAEHERLRNTASPMPPSRNQCRSEPQSPTPRTRTSTSPCCGSGSGSSCSRSSPAPCRRNDFMSAGRSRRRRRAYGRSACRAAPPGCPRSRSRAASERYALAATASSATAFSTASLDVGAPDERPVRGDERCGHRERVEAELRERLHDHRARPLLVVAVDLRGGQLPRHRAPARGNDPRASCRGREARAAPAPTRSRTASGCGRCRRPRRTRGRARGASARRKTAAASLTTAPLAMSTTGIASGPSASYGTPLGLIAITPASRSAALAFPKVSTTRPASTSARFAATTRSRSSSNMRYSPRRAGSTPGSSAARVANSRMRVSASMTTSSMPAISAKSAKISVSSARLRTV